MMETPDTYLTFQKFNLPDLAADLGGLLQKNNIPFLIEDNSPVFDVTYANNAIDKEFRVKIQQKDFAQATALLEELAEQQISYTDRSYYLFDFTDPELINLVSKPDEWSAFDFQLAQQILRERGKAINPELIKVLRNQRIEELSKPAPPQKSTVSVGYLMVLLGGFLAIFIGWNLIRAKKTLPDGSVVYSFNAEDRKHGLWILLLGTVSFIGWVVFRARYFYIFFN